MKKGIIVASFGTTYEETRKLCIESVEEKIRNEFSDIKVLRAFTSRMIVSRLKRRDNLHILNEDEAIKELKNEGIEDIYIQPLHIINGFEYEKLLGKGGKVAKPLLSSDEDFEKVVKIVNSDDLNKDEALVFMGHGSDHDADELYKKLEDSYRENGYNNVYVATVEGEVTIEDVLSKIKKNNYKKIVLQPFMLVAGDHAINDMASDEDDSWKSLVSEEGYEVEVRAKGLGEYEGIQDMYVEHLKNLMEE